MSYPWSIHIRRFQEYFNHVHIFIGSTTLQFLQFWYQKCVNILFLVVKPIAVKSGFILKLMKKIARWPRCWNIWHLSLKTKTSLLKSIHYKRRAFWNLPHKKVILLWKKREKIWLGRDLISRSEVDCTNHYFIGPLLGIWQVYFLIDLPISCM